MKKKYVLDRFISLCYDYIFVIIVLGIITFGLDFLNKQYVHFNHSWYVIIAIDVFVYLFGFSFIYLKLDGSVGKSLNDFYIESTYGTITYGRILFREIIMKQLFYLTVIGFLIEVIFFIVKKDTIHDYYLKTKVIKKGIDFSNRR
ncbi:RDD family protein [Mycoplasmatota bacterium]|nr:RDD family protein [Mycoplasmatota bacterium]